jgi:hypothetical protein
VDELAHAIDLYRLPRPIAATKAAANPTTQTPAPPAGRLNVCKFRVAGKPLNKQFLSADEPRMSCMEIAFIYWPVGMERNGVRVGLQSAPKIRDHSVSVVYRFNTSERGWASKQASA